MQKKGNGLMFLSLSFSLPSLFSGIDKKEKKKWPTISMNTILKKKKNYVGPAALLCALQGGTQRAPTQSSSPQISPEGCPWV